MELTLPPLREHPDDIEEISGHYSGLYARKYHKAKKEFSADALATMKAYHWPGNVRALRHAIERAVILSEGDALIASDLQLVSADNQMRAAAPVAADTEDLNLDRIELRAVQAALQRHRYNISKSAKELGLTRAALYRRMEKHGL